mmetsp:Transcript_39778/g.100886  ORF Transcript_39778/g.100886 Transcript_39778/m.100886 type:complete len:293 (+) Transcript_39778:393-1271(+)
MIFFWGRSRGGLWMAQITAACSTASALVGPAAAPHLQVPVGRSNTQGAAFKIALHNDAVHVVHGELSILGMLEGDECKAPGHSGDLVAYHLDVGDRADVVECSHQHWLVHTSCQIANIQSKHVHVWVMVALSGVHPEVVHVHLMHIHARYHATRHWHHGRWLHLHGGVHAGGRGLVVVVLHVLLLLLLLPELLCHLLLVELLPRLLWHHLGHHLPVAWDAAWHYCAYLRRGRSAGRHIPAAGQVGHAGSGRCHSCGRRRPVWRTAANVGTGPHWGSMAMTGNAKVGGLGGLG